MERRTRFLAARFKSSGHIQTTEKYLHAPADQKNLTALARIRNSAVAPSPGPAGE